MKLTKIFMAAGLALTFSATAQDGRKDKQGRDGHDRRDGMMRSGMMRGGMDMEEIQKKLKEIREKADADGDGELNQDEQKAFQTGMREAWKKKREDDMKKWDTNGDGELDEEERKAIQTGKADDEFKRLDANSDGVIDKKEFLAGKEKQNTGMKDMRSMFRGMRDKRDKRVGRDGADGNKAMIERFDENGDGTVDENERLKAAQATLERMERKGLSGEWKKFDKDGNGTLNQEEKDALVKELSERLAKKTEAAGKKGKK